METFLLIIESATEIPLFIFGCIRHRPPSNVSKDLKYAALLPKYMNCKVNKTMTEKLGMMPANMSLKGDLSPGDVTAQPTLESWCQS